MRYGHILHVRNVNEALPLGLALVQREGVPSESRGLKTLRVPGPVTTVYSHPQERVLFDPIRDANPFFHLIESLWILSGSNTVDLPKRFLSRIADFSDDGKTFHGAYGYRLRCAAGVDQITEAIQLLRAKPDTRQCVLSIWNSTLDLGAVTKDMPCNDMIMLDIVDGALNMTVCNRSNDVIWGAYGANAVQFSVLQEYIAIAIGARVGYYAQQSNNYHVYVDNPFWLKYLQGEYEHGHVHNPYSLGEVRHTQMFQENELSKFNCDCQALNHRAKNYIDLTHGGRYMSVFFNRTVVPAILAYQCYKNKYRGAAFYHVSNIEDSDWRLAMTQWLNRRESAK